MGGRYATNEHRALRLFAHILVSLSPVIILTTAFVIAGDRLAQADVAGITVAELIIACAVVTPFLSQTVSSPVFAALDSVDYFDRPAVARAALRMSHRGLMIGAPIAIIAGVGLSSWRGWDAGVALALSVDIFLHMVFAISMVTAFATRNAVYLLTAWSVYGLCVAIVPEAWWLAPLAAASSQFALTAWEARRGAFPEKTPSWALMFRRLGAGLSDAVPLWSLPPTLWLLSDGGLDPAIIFTALIPALIGYQVFFIIVAEPLWRQTSSIWNTLGTVPYPEARKRIDKISRRAVSAATSIVTLNLVLIVVATSLWAVLALPGQQRFTLLVAAAGAGCCIITLSYQYSILASRALIVRAAIWLGATVVVSIALRLSPEVFLVVYLLAAAVGALVLLSINRQVWRNPEYQLFWQKALRL